jgi:hypothetical protein
LSSNINDDNDDDVSFSAVDTGPQNPYLHYAGENVEEKTQRPKSGKKTSKSNSSSSSSSAINGTTSSSSSRPKSASRKR